METHWQGPDGRRVWDALEGDEPAGSHWEITFRRRMV